MHRFALPLVLLAYAAVAAALVAPLVWGPSWTPTAVGVVGAGALLSLAMRQSSG